jgi:hypothetical protein
VPRPRDTVTACRKAFDAPGATERPIAFWIWNGKLQEAEVTRQIAQMAARGLGGFFIHPMPDDFRKHDFVRGIEPEYLSDEYMAYVRLAVRAARRHGIESWLYDEGGWPSGVAAGQIARDNPELRGRLLHVEAVELPPRARFLPDPPDGLVAAVAVRTRPGGPHHQVLDITRHFRPGAGPWQPHPVGWRLLWFVEREGGYPTDLLNAATTARFIELVHERYARWVGEEFGAAIPGIFTDEPAVRGEVGSDRLPYTPGLLDEFHRRMGYDIVPFLPVLFSAEATGIEPTDLYCDHRIADARADYFELWTDLFAERYFRPLSDWCVRHNLLLVGHVGGEDRLETHKANFGHFFKAMRHLDVPGVDVIGRQLFPGVAEGEFPRFAASAAHWDGKVYVVSESFAVYGWGLTFEQMKWLTDYQYVRGVNMLAPMALYYTTTQGRMWGTLSHLGEGNPLWRHFGGFADYVARLSAAMQAGRPGARVALYYPIASLWGGDCEGVAESFDAVARALGERQIDYDIMDDDTIVDEHTSAGGGALRRADMEYQVVVLPWVTSISDTVVGRLGEFIESGGTLVATGQIPLDHILRERRPPGADSMARALEAAIFGGPADRSVGQGEVAVIESGSAQEVAYVVAEGVGPDVLIRPASRDVRCMRRRLEDGGLFLLTNQGNRWLVFEAEFPAAGQAELWDPATGARWPAEGARSEGGATRMDITLAPYASIIVVLGWGSAEASGGLPPAWFVLPTARPVCEATGAWELAIVRRFEIVEGEIREEALSEPEPLGVIEPLRPWRDLGLPDFSGEIRYRGAFDCDELPQRPLLHLGTVLYVAEVTLNGQAIGTSLWRPHVFDVGHALRLGPNDLEITVTNTLANQALRAEVLEHARAQGWENGYLRMAIPFMQESLESGLLGPVRVLAAR